MCLSHGYYFLRHDRLKCRSVTKQGCSSNTYRSQGQSFINRNEVDSLYRITNFWFGVLGNIRYLPGPLERWRSGRTCLIRNQVSFTGPWVRIPPSPPSMAMSRLPASYDSVPCPASVAPFCLWELTTTVSHDRHAFGLYSSGIRACSKSQFGAHKTLSIILDSISLIASSTSSTLSSNSTNLFGLNPNFFWIFGPVIFTLLALILSLYYKKNSKGHEIRVTHKASLGSSTTGVVYVRRNDKWHRNSRGTCLRPRAIRPRCWLLLICLSCSNRQPLWKKRQAPGSALDHYGWQRP